MNALILFSHGSVLCGAGQALEQHAERLRHTAYYDLVAIGYMNYSRPTFDETVEACATAGATRVSVVPYFLVPGKFATRDLAAHVERARCLHPGLAFAIAPPIGFHQRLADAILSLATAARPDHWRIDLERAPLFCESDPQCPLFAKERCPGRRMEGEYGGMVSMAVTSHTPHSSHTPILPLSPTALLLMVHGSPRKSANDPVFRVADELRRRGDYPIVEVGFMECNDPDIPSAIECCLAQGALRIVAIPYFLHTGKHVADDLPRVLELARDDHADVEFLMGDFLGRAVELTEILAERAQQSQIA